MSSAPTTSCSRSLNHVDPMNRIVMDGAGFGDVLHKRPAERDVEHLHTTADGEGGHIEFDCGQGDSDVELVLKCDRVPDIR